jgi:hypothetical protein
MRVEELEMTKFLRSVFAIAVLTLAAGTQAAWADEGRINGAYTVTFALFPGTGSCAGNFLVEAHGIGQTAQGPLFLTIKKCFYIATKTYTGTFALCPSDPQCNLDSIDAVSGMYDGAGDPYIGDFPGNFGPFHGTLTVTKDNSHFGPAWGTISFTAITGRLSTTTMGTAYYALREIPPRNRN